MIAGGAKDANYRDASNGTSPWTERLDNNPSNSLNSALNSALVAVVSKGFVSLSHPMGFFPFPHSTARLVGRVHQFIG